MKTQSLFQGRFQPPTILHKRIIKDQQNKNDTVFIQIVEGKKSSLDKSKNPFSYEERKRMLERLDIDGQEIIIEKVDNGYLPDIIKRFNESYPDIMVTDFFCGTDRVEGYKNQVSRSDLSEEQKEKLKINEIYRTDEDVSQSKLRVQLLNSDFKTQKKLLPIELHNFMEKIQEKYSERYHQYKILEEQNLQLRKLLL